MEFTVAKAYIDAQERDMGGVQSEMNGIVTVKSFKEGGERVRTMRQRWNMSSRNLNQWQLPHRPGI